MMNQPLSLDQLTDRLERVEKEIGTIREDLMDLRRQTEAVPQPDATRPAIAYLWADKGNQRRWIKGLFASLCIQGVPLGAEALQQRMNQAGLAPNELSRSLVEAREE